MADTPKHSVSVAGVVVDDQDRVLVVKRRDNGHWEPPGGVLELEETPQSGVIREVLEETGVSVEVERLTGVYKNMAKAVVALVFRCHATGGTPTPTRESAAVRWATREEVEEVMSDVYLTRVSDAFCSEIAIRAHDGVKIL